MTVIDQWVSVGGASGSAVVVDYQEFSDSWTDTGTPADVTINAGASNRVVVLTSLVGSGFHANIYTDGNLVVNKEVGDGATLAGVGTPTSEASITRMIPFVRSGKGGSVRIEVTSLNQTDNMKYSYMILEV